MNAANPKRPTACATPWCVGHDEDVCTSRTAQIGDAVLGMYSNGGDAPALYGLMGDTGLSLARAALVVTTIQEMLAEVSDRSIPELLEDLTWEELADAHPELLDITRVLEISESTFDEDTDPAWAGGYVGHHSSREPDQVEFYGFSGLTMQQRRHVLAQAAALLSGDGRPNRAPDLTQDHGDGYVSVWYLPYATDESQGRSS